MAIGDDGRFFPQPLDLDLDRLDPPPKKKKTAQGSLHAVPRRPRRGRRRVHAHR